MKPLSNTFLVIICFCLLNCTTKNKDKPQPIAKSVLPAKTDSNTYISLASELHFRRTFASAQFIKDDKEVEKYYRQQEKSNPVMVYGKYDTAIRKRFEELGMVKNEELLEHAFKKSKKDFLEFDDQSGKKVYVFFKGDGYVDHKPAVIGRDSCQIMFFPTGDIKYSLKDIIPGGNKEIVVLEENYFMLGYNFDLKVYEVKRN